ncbi:MAG: NrpR regulatory domain-containing protein [Dehalococcoidales bacterium]|nr:NrpR regulatory domain-containing protein [Dehalococcoidales bacterium]
MFETQLDVERKTLAILKILHSSQKPAGSSVIAHKIKDYGIELTERAVRYHLRLTDERGLTKLVRERDGRIITEKGIHEINSALVKDKVGFAISRIELLSFRTDFDFEKRLGTVPVNISIFKKEDFEKAFRAMKPAFENGLCVSNLVRVVPSEEQIGNITVPEDKIGLATVCSIVVNGVLLKAGVPMDSRFGGTLQITNGKPVRFTEIIHYNGSSLDPSEVFIKARMTSVVKAATTGNGQILANFREIPAICRSTTEHVVDGLKRAGLGGVLMIGNTSEPVCEIPIEHGRVGIILLGGLNPVACAQEANIEMENLSMSAVIDYTDLVDYRDALNTLR